jgi:hypothetical protein
MSAGTADVARTVRAAVELSILDCANPPSRAIIGPNNAHTQEAISMGKYDSLAAFLTKQAARRVDLSFKQIEGIIASKLPASAHRHPAFWRNNAHQVHSAAWLDAGWKVETADLTGKTVTFVRSG